MEDTRLDAIRRWLDTPMELDDGAAPQPPSRSVRIARAALVVAALALLMIAGASLLGIVAPLFEPADQVGQACERASCGDRQLAWGAA